MLQTKKEPINSASLIVSILTLILGIVLCLNGSEIIFKLVGYIISGILAIVGFVKIITTIHSNKKNQDSSYGGIISGTLFLILSICIFVFPKSIMITFSLCLGALLMFSGIQRLVLGVTVNKIDKNGSIFFIVESVVILLLGFVIITQKFINLIGVFLIIYAISELVSYIYYTSQNKDYSEVLNKKITKEMKEKEAKDAIIDE